MGNGHNEPKFKAAILALSNAANWEEARTEWALEFVYHDPSDETCQCGHNPIHQICLIRNRDNGNKTEVGNVCIHRFMKLASQRVFAAIKRVEADISKSLNPDALDLFARRGAISRSEEQDYLSYWRKRKTMSAEQRAQKLDINLRTLAFHKAETARMIATMKAFGITPRMAA